MEKEESFQFLYKTPNKAKLSYASLKYFVAKINQKEAQGRATGSPITS